MSERLFELVRTARKEGWYEDNPGWIEVDELLAKKPDPAREFYLRHSLDHHIGVRLSLIIFGLIADKSKNIITSHTIFDLIDKAVKEHIQYARLVTESPNGFLVEIMELPLP